MTVFSGKNKNSHTTNVLYGYEAEKSELAKTRTDCLFPSLSVAESELLIFFINKGFPALIQFAE